MKSSLFPYICYLINYILLYGIVFLRNYILFTQRFVSLGKKHQSAALVYVYQYPPTIDRLNCIQAETASSSAVVSNTNNIAF